MFSESDLKVLASKGISRQQVDQQIVYFQKGFPFMKLEQPASPGYGIITLEQQQLEEQVQRYEESAKGLDIVKFVPASGAASRMFKDFFALMNNPRNSQDWPNAVTAMEQIDKFAFTPQLKQVLAGQGLDLNNLLEGKQFEKILHYLLSEDGLNYGFLPKGLLAFHTYSDEVRTPFEEHLVEAAHYSRGQNGVARLHFTVSPEHFSYFKELEKQVKERYQQQYQVEYQISYSEQKSSTDTLAVDMDNHPFRESDGSLLFRPGGHGALLENLNDISADLIFIKNIDNVVPDHLKPETYRYKKALGGLLVEMRGEVYRLLKDLESPSPEIIKEASDYLSKLGPGNQDMQPDPEYLRSILNRPIRVCGMVRNEGEPGGGPFWVRGSDGTTSLQIVESSQIDSADKDQQAIAGNATHFNPVDLVCSTFDYRGNKFDLLKHRDPETGFISKKSKDGQELKALELPGLWNGAMADWNTVFVEVPSITFNPVKTVNDLLRPEHQPK